MRIVFSFVLLVLVSGCGVGNPSRIAPAGAFNGVATEVSDRRAREQTQLEELFQEHREFNWDQSGPVENVHPQLTEFSEDYDPRGRSPSQIGTSMPVSGL
jgi:hypothetical protein